MRQLAWALTVLLIGPVPAMAETWQELASDAIAPALETHVLRYEDGSLQVFLYGGLTRYGVGWPNEGRWRVDGDSYCSRWPPSESWACYKVALDAAGTRIRFTDGQGHVTIGTVVPDP